jgi:hypothetical protein
MNINDVVWFRLTDEGIKRYKEYLLNFSKGFPQKLQDLFIKSYDELEPDEHGYIELQLWEVMHIFGPHLYVGSHPLFVNNEILFKEPKAEKR